MLKLQFPNILIVLALLLSVGLFSSACSPPANEGVHVFHDNLSPTNDSTPSSPIAATATPSPEPHAPEALASVFASNVTIETLGHVTINDHKKPNWDAGNGSGLLVNKKNCLIWTNYHVIKKAAYIFVRKDNFRQEALVTHVDPFTDFAVLKIKSCEPIEEALLADSDQVQPGDSVYAIGNPFGKNPQSLSRGIISNIDRLLDKANINISLFQTDAAINAGNSGGGLFNSKGEVIAINFALYIESEYKIGNIGVGYAIPINHYKKAASRFESNNLPPTDPFEFIKLLDIEGPIADYILPENQGATAVSVSGYHEVGFFAIEPLFKLNDIITHINDTPVFTKRELRHKIWTEYNSGDWLKIKLYRNGKPETIEIKLTPYSQPHHDRPAGHYEGLLGMRLKMWGLPNSGSNILKRRVSTPVITGLANKSPAHHAAVRPSTYIFFANSMDADSDSQPDRVYTITGAYLEGIHYGIKNIESLEELSKRAYEKELPMILVIDTWRNTNLAISLESPEKFKKTSTDYHLVFPKPYSPSPFQLGADH